MSSIIHLITNPQAIVSAFGLVGVTIIVFLETGAFFGFFFPGDSLLFTAGLLASQGYLPISWLLVCVFLAAISGDTVGYAFGKRIGPAIFTKEDSLLFNRAYVSKAQNFYEKYGTKTIIIARFVPIVRTFAPIVAGIGAMKYRTFLVFNVIGAAMWTCLVIGLGYGFGNLIPDPDRFLLPAILVIVAISAAPAIYEILKKREPVR